MDKSFWIERWAQRQIGFHLPDVNPRLAPNVAHLGAPGRVLVPLCGKTVDMQFLAARGFEVEGVEFVPEAAQAFFDEAGVVPERLSRVGSGGQGHLEGLRHGNITIWVGDIFAIGPDHIAPVDAVYDRAALVALEPATRAAYVERLTALTAPGASLLLVTFEHDGAGGPPFSVAAEEAEALLAPSFGARLLERIDVLADNPRFRDRGVTRLCEAVFTGRRV